MDAPRKAFILAAGLGTRLRPLTLHTPKPMLPLWGRPMLAHTLAMLDDWGVRDILINLHHAPGPILRYLATAPFPRLRISTVFEPVILGTGGALRNAAWFFDNQRPFWLLNADIIAHLDPAALLRAHATHAPLATCWLTEDAGPRTVQLNNHRITNFHSPRHGHATFCGLQLLDTRILPYIAPEGFDTIIAAYQRAQAAGHTIAGITIPGAFWADIGTPAQYLQAHHDTAARLGHAGQSFHLPASIALTPSERRLLTRHQRPLPPETPIEVLPPRGSARQFYRLPAIPPATPPAPSSPTHPSTILIRWSPTRPDNRLYARHTQFLHTLGIPVPRLHLNAPRHHLLLIEDLGPETLQTRHPRLTPAQLTTIYHHLLDITLHLHLKGWPAARATRLPLMPGFTPALYAWEHAYFIDNVLRPRTPPLPPAQINAIHHELQANARRLRATPHALIHRDWQSSNILFRGPHPVMIDYQGMRRGPIAYDLASLLCDPYINLPPARQRHLLTHYTTQHPQGPQIAAAYPFAAIQRLTQTLGAYATLSRRPGMEHYAQYPPPAARQLLYHLTPTHHPALHHAITQLLQ